MAKLLKKSEKAKKTAKPKVKAKNGPKVVAGSAVATPTRDLTRIVARCDAALVKAEEADAAFRKGLHDLRVHLAKSKQTSFKHPKLGYLTVMVRKDRIFWRPKPNGRG